MRPLLLLSLLSFAGCADLAAVESGVCGNGVVEPGEACDGTAACRPPGPADECQFFCGNGVVEAGEQCAGGAAGSDGCRGPDDVAPCQYYCLSALDCEADAACGTDNFCRVPGEAFRMSDGIALSGDRFVVDQVDDDGASDVLTRTSDQLAVRYGDRSAPLGSTQHVQLPVGSESLALVNATNDGMADVLIGIGASAVLLASPAQRTLLPVQQTSIDVSDTFDVADGCPEIQIEEIATWDQSSRQVIVIGGLGIGLIDGLDCFPASDCLLRNPGEGFNVVAGGRLAHGDLGPSLDPPATGEGFAAAIVGSSYVKLFAPSGSGALLRPVLRGVPQPPPVSFPGFDAGAPFTADGFVAIADLDHDGCGDLAMSPDRHSLRIVWSAPLAAPGKCGDFVDTTAFPYGDNRVVLGVVEFGPGYAGLLVRDNFGVVTSTTVTATPGSRSAESTDIFVGSTTAAEAISLDYNHDGLFDLAIRSASRSLDYFLNSGEGYNRFVVELSREPRSLAAADVDGDLCDDVVFVADGDVATTQTANVLYGDRDARPEIEQVLGTFAAPIVAHVVEGPGIDSLLVAGNPPGIGDACNRPISILLGDTSRQLVSPLLLPYNFLYDDPDNANGVESFSAEAHVDTVLPLPSDGRATQALLIGPVRNAPNLSGYVPPNFAVTLVDASSGELAIVPGADGLRQTGYGGKGTYERDRSAVGSVNSVAGSDVVLTAKECCPDVGCNVSCLLVVDGATTAITEQPWLADTVPLPHDLELRDVDADGDDDLIGFGPGPITGAPFELWVAINDGSGTFDPDVIVTNFDPTDACSQVAIGTSLDADGTLPLRAACVSAGIVAHNELVLARWRPLDGQLVDVASIDLPAEALDVDFGDFNGDGLEDVAALVSEGAGGRSLLQFTRCEAMEDPDGTAPDASCVLPIAQP